MGVAPTDFAHIPLFPSSHTLAAHALAELGEFREALRHEKIAFAVYKERVSGRDIVSVVIWWVWSHVVGR